MFPRKIDYYSDTVNSIVAQARIKWLEPEYVLSNLLRDYIKKNKDNDKSIAVLQAKKFLFMLDPMQYASWLRKKVSQSSFNLFKMRTSNPMRYFIFHLNRFSKKNSLSEDINKILSAFFYIYKEYQTLIKDRCISQLIRIDTWGNYLSGWIDSVYNRVKTVGSKDAAKSACGTLINLMSYASVEQRKLIISNALKNLYDEDIRISEWLSLLFTYKDLIPLDERSRFLLTLKRRINDGYYLDTNVVYELDINVVYMFCELQDWNEKHIFFMLDKRIKEIQQIMGAVRSHSYIFQVQDLKKLQKFACIMSGELAETAQNYIDVMITVLPEHKVNSCLYSEVCKTLSSMNHLMTGDQYKTIIHSLLQLIRNAEVENQIKSVLIKTLYRLNDPISGNPEFIDLSPLEMIITNNDERIDLRLLAFEEWVYRIQCMSKKNVNINSHCIKSILEFLNHAEYEPCDKAIKSLLYLKEQFQFSIKVQDELADKWINNIKYISKKDNSIENVIHPDAYTKGKEYSFSMLANLQMLLSFDKRNEIINMLLTDCIDNENFTHYACLTLTEYLADMNDKQKLILLSKLFPFAHDKSEKMDIAKILFAKVYDSYKDKMTLDVLGHLSDDYNMVNNIRYFTH